MNSKDQIAQALLAQAVQPPPAAPPNPYALNQPLEQSVADQRPPMNPLITALMNHLGILGMIRNRSNQPLQDPGAIQP
jgi:hypothetical protein